MAEPKAAQISPILTLSQTSQALPRALRRDGDRIAQFRRAPNWAPI